MAIATTVRQEHERSSHSPGAAYDGTDLTASSHALIGPASRADPDAMRAVASALDSIYSRVSGAGYTLFMTDASGAVLYERSDRGATHALLGREMKQPTGRSAGPQEDSRIVFEFSGRAQREALTLATLAGDDPHMRRNARSAGRIADSGVAVLILGPTGSGKEAFAHAMHLASRRASRPFVAVNCAAIPETLIESELFGYKSGAFTGARREGMRGKIVQSAGGTLFLDEIGDMPLALQSRLLRVLEEQEVMPLGSEASVPVELHAIAASHRNLREMVAQGTFREDLYYRLNGITFELPALRYRQDKDQVIRQALAAETQDGRPAAIERDALEQLLGYGWPGNIRELRNVIRTALAICEGGVVTRMDLPREIRDADLPLDVSPGQSRGSARARGLPLRPLQAAERIALLQAIEDCAGNMTRVAARLGMSRNTLYRRMKRHGIPLARALPGSRAESYR
jgi:sigma-54 dependent transcriptional regulator, acetoin dehydrogenase operon transcriptional activator AcoR